MILLSLFAGDEIAAARLRAGTVRRYRDAEGFSYHTELTNQKK
jgi:hypothetical protein